MNVHLCHSKLIAHKTFSDEKNTSVPIGSIGSK